MPPGGKAKSKRGVVIAVVAVVLAAAAGAGVWLWQSAGSGGQDGGLAAGADSRLSVTLEERFPDDWVPDGDEIEYTIGSLVDGRWWTEDHLVREMWNEVVAYDLADGSVAWRVPVDGNGACLAAREISPEGHIAVLRGDGFGSKAKKGCHQLTVIDTTTGKEVWTKELEPVGRSLPNQTDRPVIAGGFVHVSSDRGGQSLSLEDGSPLDGSSKGCPVTDYVAVDDVLMAWRDGCRVADGNPSDRVLVGFGEDLSMLWAWQFPEDDRDVQLETVLSVDPLLVLVTSGSAQQVWQVEPGGDVTDPGKHRVVLEVVQYGKDIRTLCPLAEKSRELTECRDVLLGDGVLYLRSNLDENFERSGILAVDLDSGEELWRTESADELTLQPVRVDDDGRLIAYQAQRTEPGGRDSGSPGVVVAVDPETGSLTPLAALPLETEAGRRPVLENGDLNGVEWRDGRLAIVVPHVVVTREGSGGGAGSLATLVYS